MSKEAKVSYFFITLEKIVTLSLTRFWGFLFFFSQLWEKKTLDFFFLRKFVSQSLAKKADVLQKRSKIVKKNYLELFFYFFRKNPQNCLFFFSWQSKTAQDKKKKNKKTTIFTHSLDFCPKGSKINFSREKNMIPLEEGHKKFLQIVSKAGMV